MKEPLYPPTNMSRSSSLRKKRGIISTPGRWEGAEGARERRRVRRNAARFGVSASRIVAHFTIFSRAGIKADSHACSREGR